MHENPKIRKNLEKLTSLLKKEGIESLSLKKKDKEISIKITKEQAKLFKAPKEEGK